jgi:Uma2 family endonuclease
MHREVLEGELIVLPPARIRDSRIAKRVFTALLATEERTGMSAMFGGYKLGDRPATWIKPDVSFVSAARVEAAVPETYFTRSPELAVEVISPLESAANLDWKVDLLLAHGSQTVWVVYPQTRRVRVHHADGTGFILGIGDSLTLPELLPGWELPVAKLFE